MRVLITGGAGMVGSHCAEHFASNKRNKVLVYDNLMRSKIFSSNTKSVEYNWHYLSQFKNVKLVKKDIRDVASVNQAFKDFRPDVVIHAAAQPGVRFSLDNPAEDFQINLAGTFNVLDAARQFAPKSSFVYCSTNKVYGENVNDIPLGKSASRYFFKKASGVTEDFSIDHTGHTPYGVSKLGGEIYVQDFAHTYGLKTGVFRMSCIYGTRQFGFEDQGWIAWFAICYLKGRPIHIYGDGRQVRDVLWVDDLVRAYEAFIDSPLKHGVFNVGGGPKNTMSLRELIGYLNEITGRKVTVDYQEWRKFDQKVYISDITKARRVLKWSPEVAPKQGVEKIVNWIQSNPKLFQ